MPTAGLGQRDAMHEWDHVGSTLLFSGADRAAPVVSIAIPTYQRASFLIEATRSALRQDFGRPFEIVIFDNDPASDSLQLLLEALPELEHANFRYFRNDENIGMFGNWNRCIEQSRGEWLTILNDDDLLDPNFLTLMFRDLDRDPTIDGIVCHKRFFDQREGSAEATPSEAAPQFQSRRINFRSAFRMLIGRHGSRAGFFKSAGYRLVFECKFGGQMSRRIKPAKFFWGAILGNGGGFLFRRDKAIAIGGFYPEEFPSSDYWFYARFSSLYHLRQHRVVAASIRKAENETAKLETVRAAFRSAFALQKALCKSAVPGWWMRFAPLIMARDREDFRDGWNAELAPAEIEKELGIRLPRHRPRLLYTIQLLLRGL
jgi:glycosyltransferase involved in cell wall biosynthesis